MEPDSTAPTASYPPDDRRETSEHLDRMLVREVLAMTPAERLDTLRSVADFFARARRVE